MANKSTIRNLKFLLNEIYKFLNDFSPPVKNKVLLINDCPYDLPPKRKSTVKYGIDTIAFMGPQTWQNILVEIRNWKSLGLFKSNIKQIQSLSCRCKICRSFIANLGYID